MPNDIVLVSVGVAFMQHPQTLKKCLCLCSHSVNKRAGKLVKT